MHQIYPDDGLIKILERIANDAGAGCYWRLFESNTTPSLADTIATYTLSLTSWGRIQVPLASFTLEQVFTHIGQIQAANITFTNTTGATKTVYGYIITDAAETKLLGTARFDAAPVTVLNGGTVVVTPTLGDQSLLSV
jgi:hypothetical protein